MKDIALRNPLAIRSAVLEAVTAVLALVALLFEVITPEVTAGIIGITASLTAVLVSVVWPSVTPVAAPRDKNGNPLIEVDPVSYTDYLDDDDLEEYDPESDSESLMSAYAEELSLEVIQHEEASELAQQSGDK